MHLQNISIKFNATKWFMKSTMSSILTCLGLMPMNVIKNDIKKKNPEIFQNKKLTKIYYTDHFESENSNPYSKRY